MSLKIGVRLSWLITLAVVATLASNDAAAQKLAPQVANGPCGDPTMESSMWAPVKGKVIKVIEGNALIMLHEGKEIMVYLVAVDTPPIYRPFGVEARKFLERLVWGEEVEVWVSTSAWWTKPQPKRITGVVYRLNPKRDDVNQALIYSGMARHKDSEPYTMSNYTECLYRLTQDEARAARRGLWQIRE